MLEALLHTDGGTLIFNDHTHKEFVELFHQIGQDVENRVVILTGAGDAFIDNIDPEGFDFFSPQGYDKGKPHFAFGIVPGDGIHSLWPEVIGSVRGRTFVLTQQINRLLPHRECQISGLSSSSTVGSSSLTVG